MAVNKHLPSETVDPKWPSFKGGLLASWRDYDLASDTLMIYFGGKSVPAYSDLIDCDQTETIYLRLDIYTNEVLGLQFEGFLGISVPSRPELFTLLDGAPLHGLTRDELEEIKPLVGVNDATPRHQSVEHVLKSLIDDLRAGRSPFPREARADPKIFDMRSQAVWAR
jgi:hypothetical protein